MKPCLRTWKKARPKRRNSARQSRKKRSKSTKSSSTAPSRACSFARKISTSTSNRCSKTTSEEKFGILETLWRMTKRTTSNDTRTRLWRTCKNQVRLVIWIVWRSSRASGRRLSRRSSRIILRRTRNKFIIRKQTAHTTKPQSSMVAAPILTNQASTQGEGKRWTEVETASMKTSSTRCRSWRRWRRIGWEWSITRYTSPTKEH